MNDLPGEIICQILLKLRDVDLYSALLVCKLWNISASSYFWKTRCGVCSWKDAYKIINHYASVITKTAKILNRPYDDNVAEYIAEIQNTINHA